MAAVQLLMPKMGESIIEATILAWSKAVGDAVEADETVLEIATDKVDSEVPAPAAGVIKEIRFDVDDVVPVGECIAVIETEHSDNESEPERESVGEADVPPEVLTQVEAPLASSGGDDARGGKVARVGAEGRFYSPLVRNIAEAEGISTAELDRISGSGRDGRVGKRDVLDYLARRGGRNGGASAKTAPASTAPLRRAFSGTSALAALPGDEIVEMDRMRRLIAEHMVASVQTSPHVTSFVEVDVTALVNWRSANKDAFQAKHGEKLTFTPVFIEAVAKAIADFPMVNAALDGDKLVRRGQVNIGMAAALPTGNLIVPVIREANLLSLAGLARSVNDLAGRARAGRLKPGDIEGGTFTLTNVGTFGNVMGTPIINQPQVAIMAVGAIRKRPAVLETEHGDVIAIRHMSFLSLSYDHRVVDGMLGGSFLRRVGDYLEAFDPKRTV